MTDLSVVPSGPVEARLWRTTLELCHLFADWPWVVIGAQMVVILELEAGHRSGRATVDVDALLDVRAVSHGAREGAGRLLTAGFAISEQHPYRFVRGEEQIDLLAPDHLGSRADLTTVPPGVTASIRVDAGHWRRASGDRDAPLGGPAAPRDPGPQHPGFQQHRGVHRQPR